jgi:S1-C subfamily serine protease
MSKINEESGVPTEPLTTPTEPRTTDYGGNAQKPWIALALGLFVVVFLVGYGMLKSGDKSSSKELQQQDNTPGLNRSVQAGGGVPIDTGEKTLDAAVKPPTDSNRPTDAHDNRDTLPTVFSPDILFSRCSPAVVQVLLYDDRGQIVRSGSGFFVNADGLIATNYHVVKNASAAQVVLADKKKLSVLNVVAQDEEADVAIIRVAAASSLQPLELAGNELPPIGTRVCAIGNPLGLANTLSDGLVSGHREINRVQMIQTSAPISPGSSGGPLLGPDGRVVGITTSGRTAGQNLNFAVPSFQIAKLLLQCNSDTQFLAGHTNAIELTRDNPHTLIRTKSNDYSINGLRLGMTQNEVLTILSKSGSMIGPKSVQNPARIDVYNRRFDGSKGDAVLYLMWKQGESTLSDITVLQAFSESLAPTWRRLLTSESVNDQSPFMKEFIGAAT